MCRFVSLLFGLVWATAAIAQDSRQLDAHAHGVGQLNIAIEGASVAMEFEVPGADIVGFEYKATSAGDRARIDQALARLASPLELFVLPAAAQCVATEATVALKGDDHEEHEDHASGQHHDDHHDDHAEAEEQHTEFRADYRLTCAAPDAITGIAFAYFVQFPNAQELEVQILTNQGARAYEIERDNPQLNLSGLM